MALFTGTSSHPNTTDPLPCGGDNTTEPDLPHSHAYYALCYCILILAIIFGNVLVCLAVLRERTLQTTTNYLVVSLAVADLLVATLVMPWVVYLEVTGGVWTFSRICCDIFVTMDVMMCTASILNLCAISIDRYTAVVKPVQYQYSTGQSSCRRVSLMIVIVWMLAFAVSCPLLFGFNTTGDPSVCSISNPSFIIYSSLVSFYLPFLVTLLLYVRIYLVLRQRQKKRTLTWQGSHSASTKPCYAHKEHPERKALPNRCQGTFSPCLPLKCSGQEMSPKRKLLTVFSLQRYRSFCHEASLTKPPGTTQHSRLEERRKSLKPGLEVRRLSNGKTISSLKLAHQQPRLIQLRERKATQMLAIVLGAFIVCWLPFFLIHILNTHCPSCHVPPGLYSASTWLGYVNSALNPIIYTTFNTDFRKAFLKILCC
ncbi:D(3) dopamine receptor [Falco biarmicus]|uniref:D(3) dopamine receptor n=1 Tax=Falco rusticolus TaxID=120794 RepID=UPI000386EF9A|nr:D(3) dopamine receptor [Falco rusticolus]XP_055568853.1 D(3) dopamine receptor [Falco cherrug]XP_055665297.1 D(3) dopamine receptor [Falco peregrinus]XP_056198076.1 D(3) dopamine receptor [Falco biarmicus]